MTNYKIEPFANLCEADLRGADLSEADLRGADLSEADLSRVNLHRANLCEADLREADLRGADLSEADLYGANLCEADLHWVNLHRANLHGANLCGADLDFSVLPLWCGSFNMIVDDKFVSQLLYHFAKLNTSKCSSEIQNQFNHIITNNKSLINKFCNYRKDIERIK